jgi:hypothetical protein
MQLFGRIRQLGFSNCRGTFDAVSFVDWQFAKKSDASAGLMFSQVNGGLANGFFIATRSIVPWPSSAT